MGRQKGLVHSPHVCPIIASHAGTVPIRVYKKFPPIGFYYITDVFSSGYIRITPKYNTEISRNLGKSAQ
jgi:hypothetical protein